MYVSVMILFCTRSLKYSTDVPCPNCGLPAPPKVEPAIVSECKDWASHSLAIGVFDVGVLALPAAANESPVAVDNAPGLIVIGAGVVELLDLKDCNRFCAEDFLRIVGR